MARNIGKSRKAGTFTVKLSTSKLSPEAKKRLIQLIEEYKFNYNGVARVTGYDVEDLQRLYIDSKKLNRDNAVTPSQKSTVMARTLLDLERAEPGSLLNRHYALLDKLLTEIEEKLPFATVGELLRGYEIISNRIANIVEGRPLIKDSEGQQLHTLAGRTITIPAKTLNNGRGPNKNGLN